MYAIDGIGAPSRLSVVRAIKFKELFRGFEEEIYSGGCREACPEVGNKLIVETMLHV